MQLFLLCRRIAANDPTLTEFNVVHYAPDNMNTLLQALQTAVTNNSSQQLNLNVRASHVTAESLMRLLSFLCRRGDSQPSNENIRNNDNDQDGQESNAAGSQLQTLRLMCAVPFSEQNSTEIYQRLFHGMAVDEPPGLGHVEKIILEYMDTGTNHPQRLCDKRCPLRTVD